MIVFFKFILSLLFLHAILIVGFLIFSYLDSLYKLEPRIKKYKERFIEEQIIYDKNRKRELALFYGFTTKEAEEYISLLKPQYQKEKEKFYKYCGEEPFKYKTEQCNINYEIDASIEIIDATIKTTVSINYVFDEESLIFFNDGNFIECNDYEDFLYGSCNSPYVGANYERAFHEYNLEERSFNKKYINHSIFKQIKKPSKWLKTIITHNGLLYDKNTNNPYNGIYISYDKNKKIEFEIPYLNGKKQGIEKRYKDGILWTETIYKNGERNDLQKIYFHKYDSSNTKKLIIEYLTPYLDNKKHGIEKCFSTYYEALSETTEYKDGRKHGYNRRYLNDGNLVRESYFIDGKLHGEQKSYRKGKLRSIDFYKHGHQYESINYDYYISGQIKKKSFYKLKQIHPYDRSYHFVSSIYTYFYQDGSISTIKIYEPNTLIETQSYKKGEKYEN